MTVWFVDLETNSLKLHEFMGLTVDYLVFIDSKFECIFKSELKKGIEILLAKIRQKSFPHSTSKLPN